MRVLSLCLTLCLGALLVAGTAHARGSRWADTSPKVGAAAPDFELSRLKDLLAEKTPAAKTAAAKGKKPEKVKLSSFRGKKPVVLIFGSYT